MRGYFLSQGFISSRETASDAIDTSVDRMNERSYSAPPSRRRASFTAVRIDSAVTFFGVEGSGHHGSFGSLTGRPSNRAATAATSRRSRSVSQTNFSTADDMRVIASMTVFGSDIVSTSTFGC